MPHINLNTNSLAENNKVNTIILHSAKYFIIAWYRDSVDNTVEENSSVFSIIQMCWLLSGRACGQ